MGDRPLAGNLQSWRGEVWGARAVADPGKHLENLQEGWGQAGTPLSGQGTWQETNNRSSGWSLEMEVGLRAVG